MRRILLTRRCCWWLRCCLRSRRRRGRPCSTATAATATSATSTSPTAASTCSGGRLLTQPGDDQGHGVPATRRHLEPPHTHVHGHLVLRDGGFAARSFPVPALHRGPVLGVLPAGDVRAERRHDDDLRQRHVVQAGWKPLLSPQPMTRTPRRS